MVQAFILFNTKTFYINFGDNKIVTIHPKVFWSSESNNKTKHTELKKLALHKNKIKFIETGTFDPLINLEYLSLQRNNLINIDYLLIVNLNNLNKFVIYFNKLTQLPTKWLPNNLESLDISGNAIEYLSLNTFEGALNLNTLEMTIHKKTIEYNTFSKLTKLTTIIAFPPNSEMCTCKYIWVINTIIYDTSALCNNSNTNYTSIREYLKEECKDHIPGIYLYVIYYKCIYIYIYIYIKYYILYYNINILKYDRYNY